MKLGLASPALLAVVAVATLSACADPHVHGDDDNCQHPEDLIDGHNATGWLQGLAVAGRWQPPASVLAAGETQFVDFDNAPPYDEGSNCAPGPTPGALTLRDHLREYFPQIASVGIYNCRVIAGTNSMSLHGVGRALDIMLPTVGGDADNDLGDPIAHWLIENAEAIGIQTIIWDSSIWRTSRTPRFGTYTGSNPHVDHLHIELNIPASNEDAPWFDAPFGPDSTNPACEALPPLSDGESVILDDGDDALGGCVARLGPAQFWRHEPALGQNGLWWTHAFDGENASNTARFSLPVAEAGSYSLEVFVDPGFAADVSVFDRAHYRVRAGGQSFVVVVDQSSLDGWHNLGAFAFDAAGGGEELAVLDNAPAPVADNQRIVVDALRVTRGALPDQPTEPVEPEEPEEPTEPTEPTEPADPDGPVVDDEDPGVVDPSGFHPSVSSGCAQAAPSMPTVLALLLLLLLGRRRPSPR